MNNGLRHGLYGNKVNIGPYLLDKFQGAACAFSVRRLSSRYNGPCVTVRRDSDNTEKDIYFSGEGIDEKSLRIFCGSGSGYVKKWYDQSGNNVHIEQTTTSNQPLIFYLGQIINQYVSVSDYNNHENKPSINFVSQWLDFPNGFLGSSLTKSVAVYLVIRGYSILNGGVFGPKSTNSVGLEILQVDVLGIKSYLRINGVNQNNNAGLYYRLWEDSGSVGPYPTTRQSLSSIFFNEKTTTCYNNGHKVSLTTSTGLSGSANLYLNYNGIYTLGRYNSSGNFMQGDIQEFIIYANNVNATTSNTGISFLDNRLPIEKNINSYFNLKSRKF